MRAKATGEIGKRIEEFLEAHPGATEKQIKGAISGSTETKEKLLRLLVTQGKVLRETKPGRGGGFLYRLATLSREAPVPVEPSPPAETSPDSLDKAKVAGLIADTKESPLKKLDPCPTSCTVRTRRRDGQWRCPACFPDPAHPTWGRQQD